MEGPPTSKIDLIVEEITPGEKSGARLRRVTQFLEAGVRQVWLVDTQDRGLIICRNDGSVSVVDEEDERLGKVDPEEFHCPLGGLFGPPESETGQAK
jgi:hypothetical protein